MTPVTAKPIEPNQEKFITVRGIVAPSNWDADDQVSEVTIYTKNEEEYVVNARNSVKQLMKHFDEEIEATGYLTEDEYGEEVLIVADFKAIGRSDADVDEDEDEDDWEDENEDEEDWEEDEDEEDWEDDDEDEDEEDWEEDSEEGSKDWKRYRNR